jgi:hypothetical protein
MPLVFVHGVNNRDSPSYRAGRLAKEIFFRNHLVGASVDGKSLSTLQCMAFPYWGDLASSFAWNMASLPRDGIQALGGSADAATREILGQVVDAMAVPVNSEPLNQLAKQQFSLAVDALVTIALNSAQAGNEKDTAAFVVAVQRYAVSNPQPGWVASTTSDSQFISRLVQETATAPGAQALGNPFARVTGPIAAGAARLKQAVLSSAGHAVDVSGDFASTKLLASVREPLNGTLGRFFGDIFIYFNGRGEVGAPGPIPQRILEALDDALTQDAGEPLVIVGHSLGGVITYDLLSAFRPDITCDLFVSVGSQVGHFEEMKLYRASDPNIKLGQKAVTPKNIKRWINIYDPVDIFAYAARDIFNRFDVDAPYDTMTYPVKAHSAYFDQERFYERLRARIDGLP